MDLMCRLQNARWLIGYMVNDGGWSDRQFPICPNVVSQIVRSKKTNIMAHLVELLWK
jgi:hypothetical protein